MYWASYSFGELNKWTAKTRKDVLQRLIPRLNIAGQCSFEERFLVVKGKLRELQDPFRQWQYFHDSKRSISLHCAETIGGGGQAGGDVAV